MRFYTLGQLSNDEKSNILGKHREVYNGYKRMQNEVQNEQPLYVQDFANDKDGITVNGSGEVSSYNNKIYMKESKEVCSECGSPLMEGECMECGKNYMEEDTDEGIYDVEDINPKNKFDYTDEGVNDEDIALALGTKNPNLALAMSEDDDPIYETMTSAFEEELDEISGPSPLYSDIDFEAYNFKSDGPNQAQGPYTRTEEEMEEEMEEGFYDTNDYVDFTDYSDKFDDLKDYGEKETAFSRMKRKMGDIEDIDWEEIDEDIKESFITQKTKINEMFNRMNRYN
jgi:hypothetical protein